MPALTDPPEVQFDGGAWLATEWAPADTPPVEQVQKGRSSIERDGVEWLHWVSYFTDQAPRVFRKRVAGPQAPASQAAGAVTLTVGSHTCRVRRSTNTEVFVRPCDPVVIGA
jgi:hypothetical protein